MKHRLTFALVAACALFALPAGASAATGELNDDVNALANALFADPASYNAAGSGWAQRPVLDASAPTPVPAPTSAVINGEINGFPPGAAKFIYLTNGNPIAGYDPASTTDAEYDTMPGGVDHGLASNDVATLRIAFNVLPGGDCLTFNYRILSDETPTGYNEGLIAQVDRNDWTMNPADQVITATGNIALADNGQSATLQNMVDQMLPENSVGSSLQRGSGIRTATGAVTPGAHELFLSTWDRGDTEADTGAYVGNLRVGTLANGTCGPLVLSNAFTIGAVKAGNAQSTITLNPVNAGAITIYDANGPKVTIAAKKKKKKKVALIKKTTTAVAAPGAVTITVKPSSAGKKLLKAKGKFKVKLAIVFKPTGGTANTVYKTITIKAKKKKKRK